MARADRDDFARGLMTGDDAPVCRAANTHVTLVATVDVPNVAPADARGLYLDQSFTLSGLGDVIGPGLGCAIAWQHDSTHSCLLHHPTSTFLLLVQTFACRRSWRQDARGDLVTSEYNRVVDGVTMRPSIEHETGQYLPE